MLYNITKNMCNQKNYIECVPLCNQGIALSKEDRNFHFLSLFLFNKAYSLLYLQQKEEGIYLMSRAYALFLSVEDYTKILQMQAFLKDEFGITLAEIYPLLHFESQYEQE